MNLSTIKKLQKQYEYYGMQCMINDGTAWKLEGAYGRAAMAALESGACMLPKKNTFDYYGNMLPNRDNLKSGTKGTYANSRDFWTKVESGDIILDIEEEMT